MENDRKRQSEMHRLRSQWIWGLLFIFIVSLMISLIPLSHVAYGYNAGPWEVAILEYLSPHDQGDITHQVVDGEMAYIAYKDGFDAIHDTYYIAAVDITDQLEPAVIWTQNIPDDVEDLVLDGSNLFIITSTKGVWAIDLYASDGSRLTEADISQITKKQRYRSVYDVAPYTTQFPTYYQTSGTFGFGSLFAGSLPGLYSTGFGFPWGYQTPGSYYQWSQPSYLTQPWNMVSQSYSTYNFGQYYPPSGLSTQYLTTGWPYSSMNFGWTGPSVWSPYSVIPIGGITWPTITGSSSKKTSSSTVTRYRSPVPVKLPIDNTSGTEETGQITLSLYNLAGDKVSDQTETLTIQPGEKEYPLVLNKVPEGAKTEDLARYNLRYKFAAENGSLTGQMSLFQVADKMEVRILGSDSMYAGRPTSIGVHAIVHGQPESVQGAGVDIELVMGNKTQHLYQGTTDADGFVEALVTIPENAGQAKIRAKVASDLGTETVTEDVQIVRLFKILLTTDKPIYQPGQTIHIRTLSFKKPDLVPEGNKEIIIECEDPKGNKVFRVAPETDEFGVASADFTLGSDINMGLYTVRAILTADGASTQSEKKVQVERYVLPKFSVDLNTDADYYRPADTVHGVVHAAYFFGKDLEDALVTIEASKFDVEFVPFQTITGHTDSEGFFSFDLTLPSYFVGLPLEQGNAFVKLDIKVEDTAEHEESVVRELTVTKAPILVKLIPESGTIVMGVENKLFLLTTNPKGQGLATTNLVNFNNQILTVTTDEQGVGTFTITPDEQSSLLFQIASQANGQSALVEIDLSSEVGPVKVLLRTDKAIYTVGDVMTIDVYTPEEVMARRIFMDLIKERQTLLTKGVDVSNGHGQVVIDLSNHMAGTLLVEAYYIAEAKEAASDVFRDKKIVYVNPATDIQVTATLDKEQYLPGEKARISFQVTPAQTAALGITIVDEAVFALQENRPGLLKVYFSMEEEIMKPRFWPLIVPFEEAVTSEEPAEEEQEAAEIAFVTAEEPEDPNLDASSYPDLVQRMKESVAKDIDKDADKIAKDLGNLYVYSEWAYTNALGQGRIKTYKDPWGNSYTLTVGYNQVSLTSKGPDGKSGTIDDIYYTKPYQQVYMPAPTPIRQPSGIGWGGGGVIGVPIFMMPSSYFGLGGGATSSSGVYSYASYGNIQRQTMSSSGTTSTQTNAGFLDQASQQGQETPGEEPEAQEPRKIRRDFPETLLWEPLLITESDGTALLDANMADSITTWRISTVASTTDGRLGGSTDGIVVFQDFFIDIDLPAVLTQNDEISLPIAIYNYLDASQDVRIVLKKEVDDTWFELTGSNEKQVTLGTGEVSVVYFPIKVVDVGWHELTVFGYGPVMSDAIARRIEVLPDGMEFNVNVSDRMQGDETSHVIHIPSDAIDGASSILVKVYPGIFSQVVEGLDKLFKVPYG
ncbi:MAG: MG2 domain-containing protein [bacterium]